ncbi:SMI1/KNR4 family protein [Oribacterium sp. FC2011]|uniref:SMI1/KNR4 family protein n=1 Tax=Oribacterium sp. FC2011 TaxID=1408311 RepID=UPI0004E127B1|nr:SMI1/KNR4 family protein [Oribacterium sp. FC2011]
MSKIIDLISGIKGLKSIGGCTKEEIKDAQNKLGIQFPEDYKEYLSTYGAIRFNGVELCGLNIDGYLNVIEATEQEKEVNKFFPKNMFVIEDLGIDAKLIIGDEKGNIYLLQRDKKRLICSSFSEYVEKCKYR